MLDGIGRDNAQGEYYLTDAVALTRAAGRRAVALPADERETMGVNDRVQLAAAEAAIQQRLREAAMRAGTTLQAPETVFLAFDTRLGRDVTVEPHVVFGPGVTVADGAVVHAFSHLEGAHVGEGANVGPYARLRPGAVLGRDAKVGNFVEIKSAAIEAGAKVSHLSYIGDARVGAGANVGAGTITCNYDGYRQVQDRHRPGRLHRLEFVARRAGLDRRRRLRGLGLRGDRGRAGRRARLRPCPAGDEGRTGRRAEGGTRGSREGGRPERLTPPGPARRRGDRVRRPVLAPAAATRRAASTMALASSVTDCNKV